LRTYISATSPIYIPSEVLGKVVEGLVRNAVENTPDGGKISVRVRKGKIGPELEIKDNGIGISEENLRLIFENYFTSYDTMQYSTRQPYDFKAQPCRFIDKEGHECPGNVEDCTPPENAKDCQNAGGTKVTVQFFPAQRFTKR
jgi:hypothetical protein